MVKRGGEAMGIFYVNFQQNFKRSGDISRVVQNATCAFQGNTKSNAKKYKRDIFIMNTKSMTIPKVFENIHMSLTKEKVNFSEHQFIGSKQRPTIDQIYSVKTIPDNRKNCQQSTQMLFGDAEKCFNKLWLKYCIIDIHDAGIPEKDAMLVYH